MTLKELQTLKNAIVHPSDNEFVGRALEIISREIKLKTIDPRFSNKDKTK